MRALISFVLFVGISSAASAQAIQRIEIADPGIYGAAGMMNTRKEPGSTAGTVSVGTVPALVEATTTIPATVGVKFGFRFRAFGSAGGLVRLKYVTLVPQPGIRDPKTGMTKTRGEYLEPVMIGGMEFMGFRFDQSWEIALGTWTFELWDGDRKLASQSFDIVAPH